MVNINLTTLPAVRSWLKSTTTDDDALLTRMITQVSTAVLNELQRPSLTRISYTELRSGVGNQMMVLRNWPVISITSLQVNRITVPPASQLMSPGYTLETWDGTGAGLPQQLTLCGYQFLRGLNNVAITYQAGYCVQNQAATIPSGSPYTLDIQAPYGSWSQDDGVTYANGVPLTPVTYPAVPTVGQYSVHPSTTIGAETYTFAAADAGAAILISYSFTPAALEEAVIEWITERYRYKDRIGQTSKSLGGNETAAYDIRAIPNFVDQVLDGYRKFLPV